MRFLGALNFILNVASSWHFSYTMLSLITAVWVVYFVPAVYSTGLIATIQGLNEGPHSLLISFIIIASVLLWCITGTRLSFLYLFGQLFSAEHRMIIEKLFSENMPLQFCVVIVGEPRRNVIETLIWSVVFIFYSCGKVGSITAKSRLQSNNIRNLKLALTLIISITLGFMIFTSWLLSEAGIWMLLLMHYQGFFVLLESLVTFRQLYMATSMSSQNEIKLEIIETVLKVIQWVHLSVSYGSWLSANPLQFLILFKIQGDVFNLLSAVKRYRSYKISIQTFLSNYPPLTPDQLSSLNQENCSICWESLLNGPTSQLPCEHAYHVECIRRWIISNSANTCPLCKRVFLQTNNAEGNRSIFNMFISFNTNRNQEAVRRIQEMFPHVPEHEIRRHLDRTHSINATITHLLGVQM